MITEKKSSDSMPRLDTFPHFSTAAWTRIYRHSGYHRSLLESFRDISDYLSRSQYNQIKHNLTGTDQAIDLVEGVESRLIHAAAWALGSFNDAIEAISVRFSNIVIVESDDPEREIQALARFAANAAKWGKTIERFSEFVSGEEEMDKDEMERYCAKKAHSYLCRTS